MTINNQRDIRKLRSKDKEYYVSVNDAPGLSVRVHPNGKREFYVRYTHPHTPNRRPRYLIGDADDLTLSDAKSESENILQMVAQGIDPKTTRKQASINRYSHLKNATFAEMSQAWIEHQLSGRTRSKGQGKGFAKSTVEYWNRCLGYMNDVIGDMRMDEITTESILSVCESIQDNENKAVFVGASTRLYTEKVFDFAVARGLCKENKALGTRGQLAPSSSGRHLPAITKPDDFGQLLRDIDAFESAQPTTLFAMQILPYVFVRSIDLRSWLWEDIDWGNKMWVFAPKKGEGREDMVDSLVVPLSDQVIEKLQQLKQLTGHKKHVFASLRSSSNTFMSKATLVKAFHRLGYKDKQCAHGFRASAKTMLMEQPELRFNDIVTELQLGHKIKDTHGGAYNRLDEIDTRVIMMQSWANFLDSLKIID